MNNKEHQTDKEARILFLKYAFPCAGITLARKHIKQKDYDMLEKAVKTGIPVKWKTLEKIFVPAWRRIKEIAKIKNKNPYDIEIIRKYFLIFHNKYIEKNNGSYKDAPEALKKICRIEKAKVIKSFKKHYIVEIKSKEKIEHRPVSNMICPDAKIGDIVSVHYGYAIEII